jgi:multiple sugar transport system substrate-binding protein
MQATIDFMRWWYQPEVQLEYAKRGGNPCDKATLSRPDFDDMQPWFRTYKYMLAEGRSRDFWHHPKYAEMLSVQQEAFTSFMTGQTSDPMKVLDYVACKQQSILFEAGTAKEKAPDSCASLSL